MASSPSSRKALRSTDQKQPPEKRPPRTQQQTKLLTLAALAFLILVLGWIGTMKWNYATPENASASSIFERMNSAAIEPGVEKIKEGNDTLKSQ